MRLLLFMLNLPVWRVSEVAVWLKASPIEDGTDTDSLQANR